MSALQSEETSGLPESYSQRGRGWLGFKPRQSDSEAQSFSLQVSSSRTLHDFLHPAFASTPHPIGPETIISPLQFSKSFQSLCVSLPEKDLGDHCTLQRKTPPPLTPPPPPTAIWAHLRIAVTTITYDIYVTTSNWSLAVFYLMRLPQQSQKLSEDWFYGWGDWGSGVHLPTITYVAPSSSLPSWAFDILLS